MENAVLMQFRIIDLYTLIFIVLYIFPKLVVKIAENVVFVMAS